MENSMFKCADCGNKPDTLLFGPDNKTLYCEDCHDIRFFYCDICGNLCSQLDDMDLSDHADINGLSMICVKCVQGE